MRRRRRGENVGVRIRESVYKGRGVRVSKGKRNNFWLGKDNYEWGKEKTELVGSWREGRGGWEGVREQLKM